MFRCLFTLIISSSIAWIYPAVANEVLIKGDTVTITTEDLTLDAQRIPPAARKIALAKPDTVSQVATTLYLRRMYANQAKAEGLINNADIQIALKQAQEKILADAYLASFDEKNKSSDIAIDKQAQSLYKANPKRYEAPEQVRARHILIRKDADGARDKAQRLLVELKGGADFEQLAKESSADTGSAAKGGDLGFFSRGQMVAPFEEVVFSLKQPGDLSGIVETQFGFHIIKLERRKPAGVRTYDEVKEALRSEVGTKLLIDARTRESQRLLEKVKINNAAIEAYSAGHR